MPKVGELRLIIAKKISKQTKTPLFEVLKIFIQLNYDSKKTLEYISRGRK